MRKATEAEAVARFFTKFRRLRSGCWKWTDSLGTAGYGQFSWNSRMMGAHKFAYEHLVAAVPAGLHLDHLCRNRWCVNPAHLQPVSSRENVLRGVGIAAQNARKTHCKHGHQFTPENTRVVIERSCRACDSRRATDYKKRKLIGV